MNWKKHFYTLQTRTDPFSIYENTVVNKILDGINLITSASTMTHPKITTPTLQIMCSNKFRTTSLRKHTHTYQYRNRKTHTHTHTHRENTGSARCDLRFPVSLTAIFKIEQTQKDLRLSCNVLPFFFLYWRSFIGNGGGVSENARRNNKKSRRKNTNSILDFVI